MGADIVLRELTSESVRTICELEVAPHQKSFVAPNAVSIAQAYFEPKAWFRGVYLEAAPGLTPVGFVMLSIDDEKSHYYLWRLMIADGLQRRGFGKRVIELIIEHIRQSETATELLTSYVPGPLGPEGFYKSLGFVDTGEIEDGEHMCRLELDSVR